MVLVFCKKCGLYMIKDEFGVECPAGVRGWIRRGDLYRCAVCGAEVVSDFGQPYKMEEEEKVKVV